MKVTTTYQSRPNSNVGKIVARTHDAQKSTTIDQSKSLDANHGIAVANLIFHMHRRNPLTTNPPSEFIRSLDNADNNGTSHTSNDDGTVHHFDI